MTNTFITTVIDTKESDWPLNVYVRKYNKYNQLMAYKKNKKIIKKLLLLPSSPKAQNQLLRLLLEIS
jgi:hypothetical protein